MQTEGANVCQRLGSGVANSRQKCYCGRTETDMLRLIGVAIGVAATATVLLRAKPSMVDAAALDHVAIYVRDADQSSAFYREIFGLRQVPAPVPFARWLVLGNGTMLHIVGRRATPVSNSKWDHFAVSVPDIDAFITRLDAKGIAWSDFSGSRKPQTNIRGEKVEQIFLQDPDGYWIEVNNAHKSAIGS